MECGIKPKYQNISCDFVEKNLKLFNLEEKVIEPVKKKGFYIFIATWHHPLAGFRCQYRKIVVAADDFVTVEKGK